MERTIDLISLWLNLFAVIVHSYLLLIGKGGGLQVFFVIACSICIYFLFKRLK
jgi:hypothetical protein